MGQGNLFQQNAKSMSLDLAGVEMAIISHGHYDHGGGITSFQQINKLAPIYISSHALQDYLLKTPTNEFKFISLSDKNEIVLERLVFTNEYFAIDSGLELFSAVKGRKFFPKANNVLYVKHGDKLIQDDFVHEQNLIITENGKSILITGCSHTGIVNIIERFFELKGHYPHFIIGGFHLINPSTGKSEPEEIITEICRYLLSIRTKCFTGHCTGKDAFNIMKTCMGNQINDLSTGMILEI